MKSDDFYKPRVIEDFNLCGIAANTARGGDSVKVIEKIFISSLDEHFEQFATNLLQQVTGGNPGASLNSIYVIIKPDKKAYVYSNYPFGTNVYLKNAVKQHTVEFKNNVADITAVFFKDDVINLNPQKGDRLIWLFRENWNFGLFFDFSGELEPDEILKELGFYYRRMSYLSTYLFLEDTDNFNEMINDGWFPFVSLIGDGLDKIQSYYVGKKKDKLTIECFVDSFDKEKIDGIISRWWGNEKFNNKKKIIEAGVKSFLLDTEDGYVNAVKNLATELEGILRVSYHDDYNRKPTTQELKEYITNMGKDKYSSIGSLCFPDKFIEYLTQYIFKGFDVETGVLPESRHTVAHGVGDDSIYNKEFALKLILTLDNIYFFMGNR